MSTNKIKKHSKSGNFTLLNNEIINDTNLSFKAKGLFLYFYSKPEGWDVKVDYTASIMKDGTVAIYSGLTELEENGYLIRERYYVNGKVAGINYHFSDDKDFTGLDILNKQKLNLENLNEVNTNEYIYNNKEYNNKEVTNKNIKKENKKKEIEEKFNKFYKDYKKKVGRKQALITFTKLANSRNNLDDLVNEISKNYAIYEQTLDNEKYRVNPSRFLEDYEYYNEEFLTNFKAKQTTNNKFYDKNSIARNDAERKTIYGYASVNTAPPRPTFDIDE
jgi:hypothetical protein